MNKHMLVIGGLSCLLSFYAPLPASAQQPGNGPGPRRDPNTVSPARQIDQPPNRTERRRQPPPPTGFRSIDGSGNNQSDPDINAAHTQLLRQLPADYADGISTLAGSERPSARVISNLVNAQTATQQNALQASDFLWQWGQFP